MRTFFGSFFSNFFGGFFAVGEPVVSVSLILDFSAPALATCDFSTGGLATCDFILFSQ